MKRAKHPNKRPHECDPYGSSFFDGAGLHGGGGITGLILFCPSFREKAILCRFSE